MSGTKDRLLSFASVHHAIKAETLLTQAGIAVIALPTPREISISCGQCLLLSGEDQNQALAVLAQAGVMWSKLYSREQQRVYEQLAEYGGSL